MIRVRPEAVVNCDQWQGGGKRKSGVVELWIRSRLHVQAGQCRVEQSFADGELELDPVTNRSSYCDNHFHCTISPLLLTL
jgi:hypothetical protein